MSKALMNAIARLYEFQAVQTEGNPQETASLLSTYRKATKQYPKSIEAWNLLGRCVIDLGGDLTEAEQAFYTALRLAEAANEQEWMVEALLNIGELHMIRGQRACVEEKYQQAVTLYDGLTAKSGIVFEPRINGARSFLVSALP